MEVSDKSDTGKPAAAKLTGSFLNALSGLVSLVRTQRNARIHMMILSLVIIAGIILKISPAHWIAVSLAAGLVLAAECFNTAIESLCDAVMPEYHSGIKKAKDLAAAAVLISAMVSVIVGLIVFVPALLRIL